MVLLRRMLGDALRARRQAQHRTLRQVSTAANVSLGYLSEIERGQKEASSELLRSICDALGAQLSDVLREVSDTVALAEQMEGVLEPVPQMRGADEKQAAPVAEPTAVARLASRAVVEPVVTDGRVSVMVRRESPLKTTLRAKRTLPASADGRTGERDPVFAV